MDKKLYTYTDTSVLTENPLKFSEVTEKDIVVEITLPQKDNPSVLRGTYVHPKLINDIACWLSKEHSLMVSDIVEEYLIAKRQQHMDKILTENIQLKKEKSSLEEKLDLIFTTMDKQSLLLSDLKEDNQKLNNHVTNQTNRIINGINKVGQLLKKASNKAIEYDNQDHQNTLFIVLTDNTKTHDPVEKPFRVYRCQAITMQPIYDEWFDKSRTDDKIELIYYTKSPNAIMLYNNIKIQLNDKIENNYSSFSLKEGFSLNDLKKSIKEQSRRIIKEITEIYPVLTNFHEN